MPHVASRDGTRIGYEIHGAGPLLVLVAGATQYRAIDREGTPRLAALLSERFTVVIFDRRGRGDSTDTWPYAVAREVEDIAALIEALGEDAFLFGMSSGAVLALEAAAARPEQVRGAVLYEPPIDVGQSPQHYLNEHTAMAALADKGMGEAMMAEFMGGVMPPEAFDAFRQSPAWPAFAAVGLTLEHDYALLAGARADEVPPARWAAIAAPVLVLDGDASFPFMAAGADWVASGLPGATRETLAGQGHDVSPDILAPRIARFWDEAVATRRPGR